jgi:hypothetical protein
VSRKAAALLLALVAAVGIGGCKSSDQPAGGADSGQVGGY